MTANQTIESIERLLSRKQTIPSQMVRSLIIDCKVLQSMNAALKLRIAELEGYIDAHNAKVLVSEMPVVETVQS